MQGHSANYPEDGFTQSLEYAAQLNLLYAVAAAQDAVSSPEINDTDINSENNLRGRAEKQVIDIYGFNKLPVDFISERDYQLEHDRHSVGKVPPTISVVTAGDLAPLGVNPSIHDSINKPCGEEKCRQMDVNNHGSVFDTYHDVSDFEFGPLRTNVDTRAGHLSIVPLFESIPYNFTHTGQFTAQIYEPLINEPPTPIPHKSDQNVSSGIEQNNPTIHVQPPLQMTEFTKKGPGSTKRTDANIAEPSKPEEFHDGQSDGNDMFRMIDDYDIKGPLIQTENLASTQNSESKGNASRQKRSVVELLKFIAEETNAIKFSSNSDNLIDDVELLNLKKRLIQYHLRKIMLLLQPGTPNFLKKILKSLSGGSVFKFLR